MQDKTITILFYMYCLAAHLLEAVIRVPIFLFVHDESFVVQSVILLLLLLLIIIIINYYDGVADV